VVRHHAGGDRLREAATQDAGLGARPLAGRSGDEGLDHISLDFFGKALANDGGRHVATPEAGNARHLLVFLNERLGLPVHVRDGNLDFDLAFVALSFGVLSVTGYRRSHYL